MIHHKHSKIPKAIGGLFHRNEIAFIGAPCEIIKNIVDSVIEQTPSYSFAFADADHAADSIKNITEGYCDKIEYHQFNVKSNPFIKRSFFSSYDAVLVNGNHHVAENQIVILNSKKKESLQRKLDKLTNVVLIIADDVKVPFDFLSSKIDLNQVPIIDRNATEEICHFVENFLSLRKPELLGCILTGGKSQRMGESKALIKYHGISQLDYVKTNMDNLNIPSVVSITNQTDFEVKFDTVVDKFVDLGPFGGILSAMMQHPNQAILTCPCDVPLIDDRILKRLISERDSSKTATCFFNPETNFPEPLITIWEPQAYEVLLQFLALGFTCPRKVLINSNIKLIDLGSEAYKLQNANTQEQKEALISLINNN